MVADCKCLEDYWAAVTIEIQETEGNFWSDLTGDCESNLKDIA